MCQIINGNLKRCPLAKRLENLIKQAEIKDRQNKPNALKSLEAELAQHLQDVFMEVTADEHIASN